MGSCLTGEVIEANLSCVGERALVMSIQNWSDNITVAELNEDPQFTDEINSITGNMPSAPTHVVLNFAAISFVNSSNIAKLLRLRKAAVAVHRRLILCGVNNQVLGILRVTGLDKMFEFTDDMATALATLQLGKASSR